MCMQLGEIKKYFCHRMTVWKNKKIFGYNHLKHLKCIIILWTMEWGSWHCTGDRDQEHPHGKERQKSKMAVWEALQIAVKRREAKSKWEKERYKHLDAEFQTIARRDKKAFFSDQCKEVEETTEWERLEISSRKLEIPREHF